MSKSDPDSAIFMTDSEEDVTRKIKKAWCPQGITEENPILEYFKYIIFEKCEKVILTRPKKFGGDLKIQNYAGLEKLFKDKKIHPMDLKNCAAEYLNELLEPIRKKIGANRKINTLKAEIKRRSSGVLKRLNEDR